MFLTGSRQYQKKVYKSPSKKRKGFTLVELLIYIAIFSVVGGIMLGILSRSIRSNQAEVASNEVTSELNTVLTTIQNQVTQSSNLEVYQDLNHLISSTSTGTYLELRMSSTSTDPTCIYLNNNAVYMVQGQTNPSNAAQCNASDASPITTSQVVVNSLAFTKITIAGGHASVSISAQVTYNTTNPEFAISKTLQSAIGRVSAATFGDNLLPNADDTFDVGQISPNLRWRNGNFAGTVTVGTGSGGGDLSIQTETPVLPLTVAGAPGNPANSGTLQPYGALRIMTNTGNSSVLDIGTYNTSPYGTWIQGYNGGSLATQYPIILQPVGGSVAIGTSTLSAPLTIYSPSAGGGYGTLDGLVNIETNSTGTPTFAILHAENTGGSDTPQVGFFLENSKANLFEIWGSSGGSSYASRLAINLNTGNVGIGTVTPNSPLEVSGTLANPSTFANSDFGELHVYQSATASGDISKITFGSGYASGGNLPAAGIGVMFDGSGSHMYFGTSNNYGSGVTNMALTISPGGDIGIGTSTPVQALDVENGGGILVGNNGGTSINSEVSMGIQLNTSGGWARGFGVLTNNTTQVIFGADGSGSTLNYAYIGPSYSGPWLTINSSGQTTLKALNTYGTALSMVNEGGQIAVIPGWSDGWSYYEFGNQAWNGNSSGLNITGYSSNQATAINLYAAHVGINKLSAAVTNTLGVNGTIGASSSITANTTPDLSETMPAAADVGVGDIVAPSRIRNDFMIKSDTSYDSSMIGVVSDGSSSFMINSYGGNESAKLTGKPIVLAGRVPVNVSTMNGPIIPGDRLTSSPIPGVAMKATQEGNTVAVALAGFSGSGATSSYALVNGLWVKRDTACVRGERNCYNTGTAFSFINVSWYKP